MQSQQNTKNTKQYKTSSFLTRPLFFRHDKTNSNRANSNIKKDKTQQQQSQLSNLKYLSEIMTQKQLTKLSLFDTVKKAKGQFHFKNVYQKSKYLQVSAQTYLREIIMERKYFIYLMTGQINLYKYSLTKSPSQLDRVQKFQQFKDQKYLNTFNKCYIRSYAAHQHLGYQQYPLYWKQKLLLQVSVPTKLLLFPLDTFYKVFNNIIPLAAIQLTAQFFKKISIFKQVQMQKLLRISTFCKRIRTYPNTTIVQRNQKIQNIILLYDGRVCLSDKQGFYKQQKNGLLIGKRQFDLKKENYEFQVKTLIQCDLIVIPLAQFSKISYLKHKLKDSGLDDSQKINIKSRKKNPSNLSQYQNQKKYSFKQFQTLEQKIFKPWQSTDNFCSFNGNQSKTFMIIDSQGNTPKNVKSRPKTASNIIAQRKGGSKSVYDQRGRQFFVNRSKTSMDQRNSLQKMQQSYTQINLFSKNNPRRIDKQGYQNVTMGQMCWAKFMNRKNQLQNKQIAKIINARLPQSIMNIDKQYAVVKPFIHKKSQYIKNYKRRLKNAHKNSSINVNEQSRFNCPIKKVNMSVNIEPIIHIENNNQLIKTFTIQQEQL